MEIEKAIVGFESYKIHKDGYVTSTRSGRILKTDLVGKGYYLVTLSEKGNKKREYIHRLVGFAFIPNPDKKPFINHINGIKTDNRVENLEWITHKDNLRHAYDNGLCPTSMKAKQGAKLSESEVLEIRSLILAGTRRDLIAKQFNVSKTCIQYIHKRKTWNHI